MFSHKHSCETPQRYLHQDLFHLLSWYQQQMKLILMILIIPQILQGLSYLLVFLTALEFICAQAPLRLKGLLIGIWYGLTIGTLPTGTGS